MQAQNSLHSPRSPLSFSVLLPSDHLLIPTAAAPHWLGLLEALALAFGGQRACGSVLGLLYLASSVRGFVGLRSGRQMWGTDIIPSVSGFVFSFSSKKHSRLNFVSASSVYPWVYSFLPVKTHEPREQSRYAVSFVSQ